MKILNGSLIDNARHRVLGFEGYLLRTFKAYGDFIKLNRVDPDGNLLSLIPGGADDTLVSGDIVTVGGKNWIDGYADSGYTSFSPHDKSIFAEFIMTNDTPNFGAVFFIRGSGYINLLYIRKSSGNIEFRYTAVGATTRISSSSLTTDKRYSGVVRLGSSGANVEYYLNGLLLDSFSLDGNFSANVDDFVQGAETLAGGNSLNGYHNLVQIFDSVLSYYDIRKTSLKALGVNALGHHTTYSVDGGGTGYLTVPASDDINDIFDGGGAVAWEGRILSNTSSKRYIDKRLAGGTGWAVFQSVSGDSSRIVFSYEFNSGADIGYWQTDVITETNELMLFLIKYNNDSPSNDPTFYVIIGHTVYDLTVGAGLTESLTPSGTRDSDASRDLGILADANGSQISDMEVHQVALFDHTDVSITALGQDWSSQSPVAYWKMGNYADASGNFDHLRVESEGVGIIYDFVDVGESLIYADDFANEANGTDVITLSNWSAYGSPTNRDIQDGKLRITSVGANQGAIMTNSTVSGKVYRLTYTSEGDPDSIFIANADTINISGASRQKDVYFVASASSTLIYFRANSNSVGGGETVYSNLTLEQLSGNPAIPYNMDEANLIENRATRYQTSLSNLSGYFDYMFAGYGDKFRIHDGTKFGATDYGTALARDGEDWQGLAELAFNGSTGYVDLSSLITGAIPTELVYMVRVNLDNFSSGVDEFLGFFNTGVDNYRLYKDTNDELKLIIDVGGSSARSVDISDYTGYQTFGFVTSGGLSQLLVNGLRVGLPLTKPEASGTLIAALAFAFATSPLAPLNGNATFIGVAETALTDAQILDAHRQLARVED
jgi:hypothetical protein